MRELSDLGKSMLDWFSDFWTWLLETKIGDLAGIAQWLPDSIEQLPLISVLLGGVVTLYIGWVLVSWAIDIFP